MLTEVKKTTEFSFFPFFFFAKKKTSSTHGCDCESCIGHISKKHKLEVFLFEVFHLFNR